VVLRFVAVFFAVFLVAGFVVFLATFFAGFRVVFFAVFLVAGFVVFLATFFAGFRVVFFAVRRAAVFFFAGILECVLTL
jgi:uncharacterized membrane protein